MMKRKELLPAESAHPRAEEEYCRINLVELLPLAKPIFSRRKRRIVFITTTFERFHNRQRIKRCV